MIPLTAKHGDNVVHRSGRTPWYSGPTLLEHLESIELIAPRAEPSQLRLPVQWVSRPREGERRRYAIRLSAGTLAVGDAVTVLPLGARAAPSPRWATLDENRSVAVAQLSVSVELADNIDVGRGAVLIGGDPDAPLPVLARGTRRDGVLVRAYPAARGRPSFVEAHDLDRARDRAGLAQSARPGDSRQARQPDGVSHSTTSARSRCAQARS